MVRLLVGGLYRNRDVGAMLHEDFDGADAGGPGTVEHLGGSGSKPYFEVLVVDEGGGAHLARDIRTRMLGMRRDQDDYVYDVVVVGSLEDAVIATHFNDSIQSVVIRYSFPIESQATLPILRAYLAMLPTDGSLESAPSWTLGELLKSIRPELDLFLVTDDPVRKITGHTGRAFDRVFYQQEDYRELHLSILRGMHDRFETPFFDALREYSQRPTGVFHAMPMSRGKSITVVALDSATWASSTATTSSWPKRRPPPAGSTRCSSRTARCKAARNRPRVRSARDQTFFVTNGTSTANKIVLQALLSPGRHRARLPRLPQVASLRDGAGRRDAGLSRFVPAVRVLHLRRRTAPRRSSDSCSSSTRAGKLDRVRMLLLTNCTFDGLIYDPERVMEEVLAIKPDMIFVWDEAWFAFARFSPTYRGAHGDGRGAAPARRFRSPAYREHYSAWKEASSTSAIRTMNAPGSTSRCCPTRRSRRVRVYATQSTHKTLTALRQGSMIHVYDQDFRRKAEEAFEEAYMTHTSTSPNYQILASLDVGRRQVELEGYELVEQSVELAMLLRERILESPLLNRYFQVLKARDLIPAELRPSGQEEFYNPETAVRAFQRGVPARRIRRRPDPGDDSRRPDRHGRRHVPLAPDGQARHSDQQDVAQHAAVHDAHRHDARRHRVPARGADTDRSRSGRRGDARKRPGPAARAGPDRLAHQEPAAVAGLLRLSPAFRDRHDPGRRPAAAFFLGRNDEAVDFMSLGDAAEMVTEGGRELVSAGFVTPYPPGFPVLVPGQIISADILAYLRPSTSRRFTDTTRSSDCGCSPTQRCAETAPLEQGVTTA